MTKLIVDVQVEFELDEDDSLENYDNLLHCARDNYREIAAQVLSDEFTILNVGEVPEPKESSNV
jgi:hypothetical protein